MKKYMINLIVITFVLTTGSLVLAAECNSGDMQCDRHKDSKEVQAGTQENCKDGLCKDKLDPSDRNDSTASKEPKTNSPSTPQTGTK